MTLSMTIANNKKRESIKQNTRKILQLNKKQESYNNFLDRIKSKETQKTYDRNLTMFMVYSKIDSYDKLAKTSKPNVQILLQNFCRHLKETIHPNTVSGTMASVFKFLDCNEVEFNHRHIKSMFPAKTKPTNEKAYSLTQIQKLVGYQRK